MNFIEEAWTESTLADGDAAAAWRGGLSADGLPTAGLGDGERVALDPVDAETASARPLDATIRRRGSAREYRRDPMSDQLFATVLDRAVRGVPFDVSPDGDDTLLLNDCYCLVMGVDGVPAGTYQYHPGETALERLGDVDRDAAAHLALDQRVVGETAACVYFMTDLDAVHDRLGSRGYRLAQLEGGHRAGPAVPGDLRPPAAGRARIHLLRRPRDRVPLAASGRHDADDAVRVRAPGPVEQARRGPQRSTRG